MQKSKSERSVRLRYSHSQSATQSASLHISNNHLQIKLKMTSMHTYITAKILLVGETDSKSNNIGFEPFSRVSASQLRSILNSGGQGGQIKSWVIIW